MKSAWSVEPRHCFGSGAAGVGVTLDMEYASIPDENGKEYGASKDYLLHCIGQQVALTRRENGEIKFVTPKLRGVRCVVALALAPTRRLVAVSETRGLSQAPMTVSHGALRASGRASVHVPPKHDNVTHCISVYSIASGLRVHTLSMPSANPSLTPFVCVAFSPCAKWIAAVNGPATPDGDGEKLTLALWNVDKEALVASSHILGASAVTKVCASLATNGKLCVTTSGPQHFKLWLLAESGLKVQAVLPSPRERLDVFVDHAWALRADAADKGKKRGSALPNDKDRRVLVATGGAQHRLSPEARKSDDDSVGRAGEAAVLIFDACEQLPFLELSATFAVQLPKGGCLEALVAHARGFVVAGSNGFFAAFEHQDDAKNPYAPIRAFHVDLCVASVGESKSPTRPHWLKLAVSSNGDAVTVLSAGRAAYAFALGNVDMLTADSEGGFSQHFERQGGATHESAILSLDVCLHRPLICTVGADATLRVWNYERRKCEVVVDLTDKKADRALAGSAAARQDRAPRCVGVHPSGFQLAVGFGDAVRVYSVLVGSLQVIHEVQAHLALKVSYAHGGHCFAVAATTTIAVYSSVTMGLIFTFSGHILPITDVAWAGDDLSLFSAAQDGHVYGWDLVDGGRIDDAAPLSRPTTYAALAVRIPPRAAILDAAQRGVVPAGGSAGADLAAAAAMSSRCHVAAVSKDGYFRDVGWAAGAGETTVRDLAVVAAGFDFENSSEYLSNTGVTITALWPSQTGDVLFAGTSAGAVQVHAWPAQTSTLEHFSEVAAHCGAVVSLRTGADDSLLFSAGLDGCVFVFAVAHLEPLLAVGEAPFRTLVQKPALASDVVQVSLLALEESASRLAQLRAALEAQKADNDFVLHRKDVRWAAELKRVATDRDAALAHEKAKFDDLLEQTDKAAQMHRNSVDGKADHHTHVIHDLENAYESKLSLEMERYDRLSEEIEDVQQRCEGLLEAQRHEHEAAIRAAEGRTKKIEKELRLQIDRLHEDAKHNEQMFREVLDQQEHEYETELQQLMAAAAAELAAERDNTNAAIQLVEARNAQMARLEKSKVEQKVVNQAQRVILVAEKARNEKLAKTLSHVQGRMAERESTLEAKEQTILRLRQKNVTLDNFRFVLDHRVSQLTEEQGPIASHVAGLEAHIKAMYEELASEDVSKTRAVQHLGLKELKIKTLGKELACLRGELRERENYIAKFKRELSTMVGIQTRKELEDAIKEAYRTLVKKEKPRAIDTKRLLPTPEPRSGDDEAVALMTATSFGDDFAEAESAPAGAETELRDALAEAHSQRATVQRAAGNLKHRLQTVCSF